MIDKKAIILNNKIQNINNQLEKTLATNKDLSEQITELKQNIYSSSTEIKTSDTKPTQDSKPTLNLQPEYNNIRACGFNTEVNTQQPSDEIMTKLNIQQYINNGYRIEDICSEEKNIGYILTKKDSELLKKDNYCEEYCDKNIFGILDTQNDKIITKDPNVMLGINDSFISGSCKIDGFNFKNNDLSNATVNFYCLHGTYYFSEWNSMIY